MLSLAKWKIDEYHRMIEAGILVDRQVELLQGEIIEMSPEGEGHTYFSDRLAKLLLRLLIDQAQIREGRPITLSDDSEPEPDIAIVEPLDGIYLEHHPYPENVFWLIEYSDSSLAKDLEAKRLVYAAAGIREYWVVNLKAKELTVFRDPVNGDYRSRTTLRGGTICPISFPHLVLDVSKMFNR
jgi:Uma2 family endonuclease